jgi:hypothetical protein
MTAMTFFYQGCPVCGRNLRVPVRYFGRPMCCTHCQGEFVAGKDQLGEAPPAPESLPVSGSVVELPTNPALLAVAR